MENSTGGFSGKRLGNVDDYLRRIIDQGEVAGAGAMTLYEKGLFKRHDPIEEFIPAFAGSKVATHDERGQLLVKDAGRSITFEHLFTMTSGIPYSGPDSYSSRTFDEELSRLGEGLTTMKAAAALLPRWAMRDVTVLCCWVAASWTGNVFCPGRPWN